MGFISPEGGTGKESPCISQRREPHSDLGGNPRPEGDRSYQLPYQADTAPHLLAIAEPSVFSQHGTSEGARARDGRGLRIHSKTCEVQPELQVQDPMLKSASNWQMETGNI